MRKVLLYASLAANAIFLWLLWAPEQVAPKSPEETSVPVNQKVIDEKGETVDPVNIVMLGNSITHQGDWQEVLGRSDVFNGGKPGWTTQQLSWVIKNFIIPHRPKLCFFKGGINDYTLGISTNRIYRNMTMVMDSIKASGTLPVYTTTLYQRGQKERNLKIDSLNARMAAFCKERNFDFVDLRPFLCKNGDIEDQYIQDDNTHLKNVAYPQWAKAIRPVLDKYGL